jgi:hypothetical protein
VREQAVEFESAGFAIRGFLRAPDRLEERPPIVVHGPGFLGLAGAPHYARYHRALVAAGYAVLVFDYRGFGSSGGERGWIDPDAQITDLRAAIRHAADRDDVDATRLGLYGMGGIGAGNAVVAATREPLVRCVVAQQPVADGRDWLRRMRDGLEWEAFLARVEDDRARRARGEPGLVVDPREEIMVQTAERRAHREKRESDAGLPPRFHLASAEAILRYCPADEAAAVAALLVTAVRGDDVTPEAHAMTLFERARPPKRLVRVHGATHYGVHGERFAELAHEVVRWYDRWLCEDGSDRSVAEVAEIGVVPAV